MFRLKFGIAIILVSFAFMSLLLFYQNSLDHKAMINATFGAGIFILGPGLLIFVGNSGALTFIGFHLVKLFLFIIRDYRYMEMDWGSHASDSNFVMPFMYLFIFLVSGIYLGISFTMLHYYNLELQNVLPF